jgi:hypothetical protein
LRAHRFRLSTPFAVAQAPTAQRSENPRYSPANSGYDVPFAMTKRTPTTACPKAATRKSPAKRWIASFAGSSRPLSNIRYFERPNGWRLSGEGGEADRVRCSRGLGAGTLITECHQYFAVGQGCGGDALETVEKLNEVVTRDGQHDVPTFRMPRALDLELLGP